MTRHETYPGILVAVDGSPSSLPALLWAIDEAAMRRAALAVVHVRTTLPSGPTSLAWAAAPIPQEFFDWQEEHARLVIRDALKVVDDAAVRPEVPLVTGEILCGATVSILIGLSKDAQIIVVGCRNQDPLRRGLLGSVSNALVHHAHCPVAVISEPSSPHLDKAPVLVGIDGSPTSDRAIEIAFDEASRRGVDLVAVHAWSDADLSGVPRTDWSACQSAAEKTLTEQLARWQQRYPAVIVHPRVVADEPARHLLDESRSAQIIVVGSHGRGGFAGMLLGSVSTTVVHAAATPVIVARHS